MPPQRPLLYAYFDDTAQILRNEFQRSSQQKSPTTLGRNREFFCSEFLSKVLPQKLPVKKGEIWDSQNNKTGQLDVIVVRDDCPCLHIGSDNIYLAEGVFAAIEVKSNLTTTKLQEAGNTLRQVQDLSITGGPTSYSLPVLKRPLRIVFSYRGATWETLTNYLTEKSLTDTFDIICILNRGIMFKNGLLLSNKDRLPHNSQSPDAMQRFRAHQEILNPTPTTAPIPHFLAVRGKAAALGFLYLHLLHFGISFVVRSVQISRYFEPMNNWEDI